MRIYELKMDCLLCVTIIFRKRVCRQMYALQSFENLTRTLPFLELEDGARVIWLYLLLLLLQQMVFRHI